MLSSASSAIARAVQQSSMPVNMKADTSAVEVTYYSSSDYTPEE